MRKHADASVLCADIVWRNTLYRSLFSTALASIHEEKLSAGADGNHVRGSLEIGDSNRFNGIRIQIPRRSGLRQDDPVVEALRSRFGRF